MEINLSNQLKQKSGIEIRESGEGAIALNLNNENYYSLNNIAYQIYQQIITAANISEAIANLTDEFEVNPLELEQDVVKLTQDLIDQQFLEVVVG